MERLPSELVIQIFNNLSFVELYNNVYNTNISKNIKDICFTVMKNKSLHKKIKGVEEISENHELSENWKKALFGEFMKLYEENKKYSLRLYEEFEAFCNAKITKDFFDYKDHETTIFTHGSSRGGRLGILEEDTTISADIETTIAELLPGVNIGELNDEKAELLAILAALDYAIRVFPTSVPTNTGEQTDLSDKSITTIDTFSTDVSEEINYQITSTQCTLNIKTSIHCADMVTKFCQNLKENTSNDNPILSAISEYANKHTVTFTGIASRSEKYDGHWNHLLPDDIEDYNEWRCVVKVKKLAKAF